MNDEQIVCVNRALGVFSEPALEVRISHDATLRNFYTNNYFSLMEVNDNVCFARLNNRFMLICHVLRTEYSANILSKNNKVLQLT